MIAVSRKMVALGLLLTALLPSACHEIPTEPGRGVTPSESLSPGDGGTNPNDTFLSADLTIQQSSTITTSEPIYDPSTGGMSTSVTVVSDPLSMSVDAGYDYQDNSHVNLYFNESDAVAPSDRVAIVRSNADSYSEYDASGNTLAPAAIAQDPMGTFSTDTGSFLNGIISSNDPGGGGGVTCPPNCETDLLVPTRDVLAGRATSRNVVRKDANHVEITTVAVGVSGTISSSASVSLVDPFTGSAASGPPSKLKHVRQYEKRGNKWVLQRSQTDIDEAPGSVTAHHTIVMSVSNVKWQENTDKESKRKAKRDAKKIAAAMSSVTASGQAQAGLHPSAMVAVQDVFGGGFIPALPSAPDPDGGHPQDGTQQIDTTVAGVAGGVPIVLQHGFDSSAETWGRMIQLLHQDTDVGDIMAKSLDWQQRYEDQAVQLHRKLRDENSFGQTPVVLVGHSNGGMVARYLGMHPDAASDRTPLNVKGVITLGTLHEGAPLANVGRSMQVLFDAIRITGDAICPSVNNAACNLVRDVANSKLGNLVSNYSSTGLPVLAEMTTGGPYHQAFDQVPENTAHYSISNVSWQRWRPWGLAGDMRADCTPEGPCGGRNWVKTADRTYHRMVTATIFGAVFGYFTGQWVPFGLTLGSTAALVAVSDYWNQLTSPGETTASDGLVPYSSQQYPHTPLQFRYQVTDGDSHVGETKSTAAARSLELVLTERFGVLRH